MSPSRIIRNSLMFQIRNDLFHEYLFYSVSKRCALTIHSGTSIRRFSESSSSSNQGKDDKKKPSKEKSSDTGSKEPDDEKPRRKKGGLLVRRRAIEGKTVESPEATQEATSAADPEESVKEIARVIKDIMHFQVPKPSETLVLPYTGRPLFPGFTHPLTINNRNVFNKLKETQKSDTPYVGLFYRNNQNTVEEEFQEGFAFKRGDFSSIGTFAQIVNIAPILPIRQSSGISRPNFMDQKKQDDFDALSQETIENATEWNVLLKGQRRIEMVDLLTNQQPLYARIEHLTDRPVAQYKKDDEIKVYVNEIFVTLKELVSRSSLLRDSISFFSQKFDGNDPYYLADFSASVTSASPKELQNVLVELNLEKRLMYVLELLKKELKLNELQQEILQEVEKKVSENQRKYFLRQQLQHIQKELGLENDDKSTILGKFREKLEELDKIATEKNIKFPQEPRKVINEEMEKLQTLEKDSSEFNQTRRYLEWLTAIGWTKYSVENYDLVKAHEVLEKDHYGLDDIKERIMEYIAVGNLKGEIKGKILLLVGPPGVGKTSIGKSIASALGREFYRFSVGGLSDVSEIKGHRRTYVGAMPGKIIQCLKQVQTMNPLILIDEIDKLSSGYRGDPASALLELLDPSQNQSFMDHYLDVPVDVSKILFVCTANVLESIPGPLLDRMEVLRLSGYDLPEKVSIAKNYLVPRAKTEAGLSVLESKKQGNAMNENDVLDVQLSEQALEALSRWYCREAGVRKLQQLIERIYRKVALMRVQQSSSEKLVFQSSKTKTKAAPFILPKFGTFFIQEEFLEYLVGKPVFQSDRLYEQSVPPGVVMGLAWTAFGGSSLYIETTSIKAVTKTSTTPPDKHTAIRGKLVVTGNFGDVMKESSTIAYTNAKHFLSLLQPENTFFTENEIHLHVPEGATPKDGPSAGVTMTTALLSLAMNTSISADLAMTGEISLTGMVLPVGGIKEKVIAARRSGVHHVLLPDANRKDVDELPDYLKDNLKITFAKVYGDVFKEAFPGK